MPRPMTPAPMRERRGYAAALVSGLLGATAVTVAVARPWVRGQAEVPGLPQIQADVSGAALSPLAGALGVVLLASFGAVIATRAWVRRTVGVLIVAAAAVVVVVAAAPPDPAAAIEDALSARGWAGGGYSTRVVPWRWLALVGAACCLLAGAAVAWLGHRWPVLGGRYDAPASSAESPPPQATVEEMDEDDVWRALDRGHDPTQDR